MIYQFTLRANGYHIVFNGQPVRLNQALDTIIDFQLHPNLGGQTISSTPVFIRLSDLQQFLAYLEEHIEQLRRDPSYVSDEFVTMELGFLAQAHSGDVDDHDDGDFVLRFMINVGIRGEDEDDTRVYVGGETGINVPEVRDFIRAVQKIVEELEQKQP